jgi:hypothetical protein
MFFIQSRKIHFLFIAGPYFKISAVTTSTHLSNAAFSFASSYVNGIIKPAVFGSEKPAVF